MSDLTEPETHVLVLREADMVTNYRQSSGELSETENSAQVSAYTSLNTCTVKHEARRLRPAEHRRETALRTHRQLSQEAINLPSHWVFETAPIQCIPS